MWDTKRGRYLSGLNIQATASGGGIWLPWIIFINNLNISRVFLLKKVLDILHRLEFLFQKAYQIFFHTLLYSYVQIDAIISQDLLNTAQSRPCNPIAL